MGAQRLRATDTLLAAAGEQPRSPRPETPRQFLHRLVSATIDYLNEEATDTRTALEEVLREPVQDAESKADLIWLVETLSTRRPNPRAAVGAPDLARDVTWQPIPGGEPEPTTRCGQWAQRYTTTTDPTLQERLRAFDDEAATGGGRR